MCHHQLNFYHILALSVKFTKVRDTCIMHSHLNCVDVYHDELFSQNNPVDSQAFITPAMNTRRYIQCILYSGKLWRVFNLAKQAPDDIGKFLIWRFECSASYVRMH